MYFGKSTGASAQHLAKLVGWSMLGTCALTFTAGAQTTTAPASAGFESYQKPFAASSPWNSRPISPVLDTYEIPKSSYYPSIERGTWSTGLFLAKTTDTPMTVVGRNGAAGPNNPDTLTNAPVTLPRWPANTLPATGADGHADIYDPVTGIIHSFWQLKQNATTGKWEAALYAWSPTKGTGWGDPAHYYHGARATGVPAAAGLIRTHEIADGQPTYKHALAMSLTYNALSAANPYVFPATSSDGDATKTNYGKIPQGALMMLPASYDSSKIGNPDLRKIVETLKTYGAYVVDRNTGTPFAIYAETGAPLNLMPNGWSNSVAAELDRMRANLRQVVSAQSWVDGNGKAVTMAAPASINTLSMRGPWSRTSGTTTPYFDQWAQALVFPASPTATVVSNGNGSGMTRVTWAKTKVGTTQKFSVAATGGARLRVMVYSGSTIKFTSGNLGNGESARFVWPDGGWIVLVATGGVNTVSTVRAELAVAPDTVTTTAVTTQK
ncbi:MAG: Atrophin-1 multi-domain protein [Duganella sp.]